MMQIDWVAKSYTPYEGYGRYGTHMIRALRQCGAIVTPRLEEMARCPDWIKQEMGIVPGRFTISCLPPFYLQDAPSGGRHWLLSMTEGSELPTNPVIWAKIINSRNIERVIVPCEHNADVFRRGGVKAPVHVIPGGTDPLEFPVLTEPRPDRPYTFLTLGDRGSRKGWHEVWKAFWFTFKHTPDVRLIIKCRPGVNDTLDLIAHADNLDPRIVIQQDDAEDMREVFAQADCVVLPSRSEGWGMPHREAACMGLPVIVQRYSGLDDGNTDEWAFVVEKGRMDAIPEDFQHIAGEWRIADVVELAGAMRRCYEMPKEAAHCGRSAARWIRANQTWHHAAKMLLNLIEEYGDTRCMGGLVKGSLPIVKGCWA